MSAISAPVSGKGAKTETYVVARRKGAGTTTGYLYCVSCGYSTVSKGDFARYAGVTLHYLNRFLNREPIREDIAAKIRSKLLRVEE